MPKSSKKSVKDYVSVDLKEHKVDLKDVRKLVNSSKLDVEVDKLQELKATYHGIPKIKSLRKRLDALTDALVQANSHEERLVAIRVSLSRCQRVTTRQYDRAHAEVINEDSILGLSKKDQDLIIDRELLYFSSVTSDVEYKIEQVDMALHYVRNTSFNIKTLLSTLKVLDHAYDREV